MYDFVLSFQLTIFTLVAFLLLLTGQKSLNGEIIVLIFITINIMIHVLILTLNTKEDLDTDLKDFD